MDLSMEPKRSPSQAWPEGKDKGMVKLCYVSGEKEQNTILPIYQMTGIYYRVINIFYAVIFHSLKILTMQQGFKWYFLKTIVNPIPLHRNDTDFQNNGGC